MSAVADIVLAALAAVLCLALIMASAESISVGDDLPGWPGLIIGAVFFIYFAGAVLTLEWGWVL